MRLTVRLTPRAGRDRFDGWAEDAAGRPYLKVKVSAAPVDGQANAAMLRLVAKAVGRPISAVRITAGETGRMKRVEIDGVDEASVAAALGGVPK